MAILATITTTMTLSFGAPADATHAIVTPSPVVLGVMHSELTSWLNAERAARGMTAVTLIADTVSQTQAQTVSASHVCSHPSVSDRTGGTGMTWRGEVASCGTRTAQATIRNLMSSDGHRRILLDPEADHVAVGLACHSPGTSATWVLNMYSADRPAPLPPAPPATPVVTPESVGMDCTGGGTPLLATLDGPRQGFVAITSVRVADTRATGRLGVGGVVEIDLSNRVAADATAVVLSLVAVDPASPGHLRVFPAGSAMPNVSSLNYDPSEYARSGFAIVPVDTTRRVRIYASSGTNVVVDLAGYAAPSGHGIGLLGASPRRALDTRAGGGTLQPGTAVTLDANQHGVPTDATGIFVTVTSTGAAPGTNGHVTAWAAGSAMPTASTLNVIGGADVANMAFLPLSAEGLVSFAAGTTATHLIVDIAAYTSPTATNRFVPTTPVRRLDSRTGAPIGSGVATRMNAVPINATAVFAGLTSSGPNAAGWMSATGIGQPHGTSSALNVLPGRDIAGFSVVPVAGGGMQTVSNAIGHHLVDVFGYLVAG